MKHTKNFHNKRLYYLGKINDELIYLESPTWDCGHYWGAGYIETFNKRVSDNSQSTHTHFKGFIIGQQEKYSAEKQTFIKDKYTHHFNELAQETVLTDTESWILSELMNTINRLREASELFNRGGTHITTNPSRKELIDDDIYKKINKVLLPKLFEEVDKLLKGENDEPLNFTLTDKEINTKNGGRY